MKRFLIIILSIMTIAGCSNALSSSQPQKDLSLSAERVQELRKTYPVSGGSPANLEMRDIPFEEVLSYADAVVVVTIGERNPDLEVGLITEPGTPEGNLSEKQEAQGAKPASATFISYQAQVKEAVAGAEVGQEINLIVSEELQSVEPVLQPGMEILTAIKKGIGEEQQNNYSFTRYGTYYVVDDNYVLSAFEAEDQDTSTFTEDTNGKTLENLIEKVQEIKAE